MSAGSEHGPVIVAVNAGSSSVKVAAFDADTLACTARAAVELSSRVDHASALAAALAQLGAPVIGAFVHRIVHGGARARPCRITDAVLAELRGLVPLAPLHQPHGLAGIAAARTLAPGAAEVACFDTSFHLTAPDVARRYALPAEYRDIDAYGFHGLSYEHVAAALPPALGGANARVIAAHLGSGASLCALLGGRAIATTMGMTPLDGLVMSTRCGALDPGVVLYLLEERGLSAGDVRRALYERSGLYGVSETSGDMRELQASAAGDARAAQAIDLFIYRAVRAIGSLAAALGGLDAIVFTGGIGEHAAQIRDRITAGSRWLGAFQTLVIAADEEAVMARHARALL